MDGPTDTNGWRLFVYEACLAINHLADWIAGDSANKVTLAQLRDEYSRGKWLKASKDVANTFKHHTGDPKTSPTSGKVSEVTVTRNARGESVGAMIIELIDSAGNPTRVDSREVIRGAIAEWREIFEGLASNDPVSNQHVETAKCHFR
jgi:hypothetical protein